MGHEGEIGDWHQAPLLRRWPNWFLLLLARAVWGFRVSGLEHLPPRGPLIVAGNHVSLLDGPLVAMGASPLRYMRFLGKAEIFKVPLLGWYLRKAGAIPLDRKKGDVAALRAALDILGSGGCLALFPEGTRSKTGRPGRPKAGVGFLAGQTGATVVPARLINTDRFPRGRPLEVRFGPGLKFCGDSSDREECLAFAEKVMERVFAL